MDQKRWANEVGNRIVNGLYQEIGIVPNRNYHFNGHNASRVVMFRLVRLNPGYIPKVNGLQRQLTGWVGLPDSTPVRLGHDGRAMTIEVPKPHQDWWKAVTIEALEQQRFFRRGPIATLGLGLQDDPKRIDFREPAMAHVLISGQTRSGKTNTQKLIGWNLAAHTEPNDSQLIIFDVAKAGYKWADFGNVAHLAHPVITEVDEANAVLCWLNKERK